MKNRKSIVVFLLFSGIIFLLVGVTYSFFNYTKTGTANNIRVGRIYFSSNQQGTISLTNVFPIKSEDLDTDQGNHDSITITINGDTNYSKGVEYLITFDEVNNSVNDKKMPLKFIVKSSGIGTGNFDYYNARGGNNSIYKLTGEGIVEEDKYILVGYIAEGVTGVNGNIEITSFIDKDSIAISDTYPPNENVYTLNSNLSTAELNYCVSFFDTLTSNSFETEELEDFCNGTGKIGKNNFQNALDNNLFFDEELEYLLQHNIIIDSTEYYNGTSFEWVNGKTVFTTSEWNNFDGNNALSFKIKVEANEGIWVEPESTPDKCFTMGTSDIRIFTYSDNITEEKITSCVNYVTNLWGVESSSTVDDGESYHNFCAGTGTRFGMTLIEALDEKKFSLSYNDIENIGIINVNRGITIFDYDKACGSDVVIPSKISVPNTELIYKDNLNEEDISKCVNYLSQYYGVEEEDNTVDIGESYHDYCVGTGTNWGEYIQDSINNWWDREAINDFISLGLITERHFEVTFDVVEIFGEHNNDTNGAFNSKELTSVYIPNTIRKIYGFAFSNNNISSITIPNSVNFIGRNAFFNNQLTNVEIPDSVTTIDIEAFKNNNISSIKLGNGISHTTSYISSIGGFGEMHYEAFDWKKVKYIDKENIDADLFKISTNSSNVLEGEITLGSSTKKIGKNAFYNNNITSIHIPDSVIEIGAYAFEKNLLTSVEIPNSVTKIGQNAFDKNQLTSVTIGNGIETIGSFAFYKYSISVDDVSNLNLSSIRIDKQCSIIKNMNYYDWIGPDQKTGTTIYGANDEVCDAY